MATQLPTSAEFDAAAAAVNNFQKMPDRDDALKLYSHFKYSRYGENNDPFPAMFDLQGKAKWNAWKALSEDKNMTRESAQKEYIKIYESIKAKYE